MLVFNYGYHEFWEPYDPSYLTGPGAPAFGAQNVTFDGANKLILVNEGVTDINVKVDIYSNWKEWMEVRDNSKFPLAITAIGGDPITDVQNVGITYFLENGWRILPWEQEAGGYVLTVSGNLYTRETGQNPVNPVSGVSTSLTRSNLVDIVSTGNSVLTAAESAKLDELWVLAGLDATKDLVVDPTSRTAGPDINQTISKDVGTDTVTVTRSNTDPIPGA